MRAKRLLPSLIAVLIVGVFGGTLWFLWQKSRPKPAGIETEKPVVTDVIKRSVAAGAIQPRKEIEIKPKIAGILKSLYVEAGQKVKQGDLIAEVQIIPDAINLNEAQSKLESARVAVNRLQREMTRGEALGAKGAYSATDLDKLRADFLQAKEDLRAAGLRVQLVREGSAGRSKSASTRVESTVAGTILSVLLREGSSVIQANNYNAGTTIVSVADMADMIFKGQVDEADVGKLKAGMPVEIVVGALDDLKFEGTVEQISPKSIAKDGATQFEIQAAVHVPADVTVRAGYSANANIVLARRDKVLAINEGLVVFDGDKRFVEVQVAPNKFERREVKLGLSDGIKVEVLSGVKVSDVLKKPRRATPSSPT